MSTEDQRVDRVWIWWEGREPRIGFTKPLPRHNAVEYMRVLSRHEVEQLASSEGVDVMQMVNSQLRTIEGQRRHISTLQRRLDEFENPSAHVAAGVTGHD